MQIRIPFSPPRMDEKIIEAVSETLRSGWITTGPKTKLFEKKIAEYCDVSNAICLNSATAGLEIMLRWFGVKEGDEVILPAYTYAATANVVMHCGAKPILVDVGHDFNIDLKKVRHAITSKTKAIIPVDIGGMPVNYTDLMNLVKESEINKLFQPTSENQKQMGRIFILADSAHSFGANFKGKKTGNQVDAHVFSFHAVKNLSTAEGGAVTLNLPSPFKNEEIYKYLCVLTLHGQSKDALAKQKPGMWKYDIVVPGYKCNMMDIQAAIGLVEIERYDVDTLLRRKKICESYNSFFLNKNWAITPVFKNDLIESSYHLYMLRINNCSENTRDKIIELVSKKGVSVNVHFIPLPMLTAYSCLQNKIEDYPIAYKNFSCEISLPVFYSLNDEQLKTICDVVASSVEEVLG